MKSLTPASSPTGIEAIFKVAARFAFAVAVILIPFRLQFASISRWMPPLYTNYTELVLYASDIAILCTLALWVISLVLARRLPRLGPRYLWISRRIGSWEIPG